MTTLIIDNAIHRSMLQEGKWTSRYVPGKYEILIGKHGLQNLDLAKYDRGILTGSEATMVGDVPPWIEQQMDLVRKIVDRQIPLFGICFGHQLIARALGGAKCVRTSPQGEMGWFPIELLEDDPLYNEIPKTIWQLCLHFDEVVKPPPGFKIIAKSARSPVHAMTFPGKPIWTIQSHPEIKINEGRVCLILLKLQNPFAKFSLLSALRSAKDSKITQKLFTNFMEAQ